MDEKSVTGWFEGVGRTLFAVCGLLALAPYRAGAQEYADRWQWNATLYLWLPTLDGDTSFPPTGGGPAFDVSADQILDSLEFVFMGAIGARRGPWGVSTDVIYLDLGASKKATRNFGLGRIDVPSNVTADVTLDVTGWLWSLDGTYALIDEDAYSVQALAGVRMLDLEESLDWAIEGDVGSLPFTKPSGSSRAKDTQWDAILGVEGRVALVAERRWYVPYHLDLGAGESDFTWQAMVGLGYDFARVDVMGVWRHLDYDLGDNAPIRSIEFDGPAVGFQVRF